MFPSNDDQNPYSSAYQEEVLQPQSLEPTGTLRPTVIAAGDALNHAWDMFKQRLGILIGAFVIVVILQWLHGLANFAIQVAVEGPPAPQPAPFGPGGGLAAFNIQTTTPLDLGLQLVAYAVQTFLGIGLTRMNLSAGRGETPEFGQIFSGGPWSWRVVGFSILFGLAVMLGFVLLIIPGIIMLLMWWPAQIAIVDNQAGVMGSFKLAAQITKGNWGTAFVLLLVSFGVNILGVLAFCVGLVFSLPFTYLLWATAYLMMSGQVGRIDEFDQGPMDYGFDQI